MILVTHDLHIGGLQRVVTDIARHINKEKFEVAVCAMREGGDLEALLIADGIRVIKLPKARKGVDYFSFWKLFKIFKETKPSIVHTHNSQPFIEGTVAALMARVPILIHTEHGRHFPDKKRYMLAERVSSFFVNQIICVSQSTKRDLVNFEKIEPSKISVIINGVDEKKYKFNSERKEKKRELCIIPGSGPILGWCGRLSQEKGLTYLIKTMDLLKKDFPNILLLIVGEGELWDELNRETKELGLENHILFLGARRDIHEIMGVMDLFVLPSLREGLPLVLLEAMAASLPIVATHVGGNSEAVRDGINGLLVKSKDSFSLYLAIKRLLGDQNLRDTFSRNALRLFDQQFTLNQMVRKYEQIYEKALKLNGKTGRI